LGEETENTIIVGKKELIEYQKYAFYLIKIKNPSEITIKSRYPNIDKAGALADSLRIFGFSWRPKEDTILEPSEQNPRTPIEITITLRRQ